MSSETDKGLARSAIAFSLLGFVCIVGVTANRIQKGLCSKAAARSDFNCSGTLDYDIEVLLIALSILFIASFLKLYIRLRTKTATLAHDPWGKQLTKSMALGFIISIIFSYVFLYLFGYLLIGFGMFNPQPYFSYMLQKGFLIETVIFWGASLVFWAIFGLVAIWRLKSNNGDYSSHPQT
jgi:hypothetical protein